MDQKQNAPIMPLALRREAAMADAVEAINRICERYMLPYHVLEDITYRLHADALTGAASERVRERQRYNDAMKAYTIAQRKEKEALENEQGNHQEGT